MAKKILNLLMIDEEQLYAERLVELLSAYYDQVNLGFLDEKEELIKSLRHEWDVLVFHRAYDMTFTDVVGILQEHGVSLPLMCLTQQVDNAELNEHGYPEVIYGDMIKSVPVGKDELIVAAICLQADYVALQRQIKNLRTILKDAEQRANILIKNSKSAVAYIDQGMHIFANDPYLELFGYQTMDDIIGVPVVDLIADGADIQAFKKFLRNFDKGDRSKVEFEFRKSRADGSSFVSKLQLAMATLDGEPVTQVVIQHTDAQNIDIAKKIAEVKRQDDLTGLTNRIAFVEALQLAYRQIIRGDLESGALLYVRMDNAGQIRASAGIAGVDMAVKKVATLLKTEFDKVSCASVFRVRDAGFAVIIHNIAKDDVVGLAQNMCHQAENMLIEVNERTVTTGLSVSVVMMDNNMPEPQILMERALDTASAASTDEAGEKVQVFDISQMAGEDDSVMGEYLQTALAQNTLKLTYRAVYDINTDSSNLFETYVSLPQADGSELNFAKLIPIAKKYNLIEKLDHWVLINASKHLALVRQTEPNVRLLLSLSSASLSDVNLPNIITQLVRAIGGGSEVLTLQFHEQDLIDYMAVAKRLFLALDGIDCQYGVYDFGSTDRSVDMLNRLAPKLVRLSHNYTKDLERETNLEALKNIVSTANERCVPVLMPYIEEASTMSLAWSCGVRFLEGNYLQPAMPSITVPKTDV